MSPSVRPLIALVILAASAAVSSQAPAPAPSSLPAAAAALPPRDLRPLLVPRQSELRLVVTRYTLDRATLHTNFLDGLRSGPGGGRPGTTPAAPAEPVSTARIARLKRFDLDWQAALGRLDGSRLTPAARAELDSLTRTIAANLAQLDTDAVAIARVAPVVPFASVITQLVEARIRIEDVDPMKVAGVLTALTSDITRLRVRLESALTTPPGTDALVTDAETAKKAASVTAQLRRALNDWFIFYNGYDPLFTWWMGLPYKRLDTALGEYATFLNEKVAPVTRAVAAGDPTASPIPPAAPPAFASVPDLAELIALPQDEMADLVQRFRGAPPAGPGARGGAAPGPDAGPAPARDRVFYQAWLTALKSLDFKILSRNAQVDYLYIRTMAELGLARDGVPLPANPPRKTDASGIPGAARGREGLIRDLQDELIPYSPEELIAFAETEFAWCEREMKKASAQLGFGDDWFRALEHVKGIHPPPGRQKAVVRDMMFEAVDYLRQHDLLTVPAVAAESLHMIMMTPERQLVNPFFTGGFQISVSYPTDTMEYDARIQSMRGNNTPFSHAVAHHEMIPGHNLVFYTNARYQAYRPRLGGNSPFFAEGWPLYWELVLYEKGFHDTPEEKVGALFWRMHRCARIVFSLKFHMGQWSPQECVDFLVDRVGFERDNAMGEVRRSFQGSYGPLYQAAYLLGGLQLRSLRRELVDAGTVSEKAFHDEVLRQGAMPITMLRLALNRQPLTRDMPVEWRFLADAASR